MNQTTAIQNLLISQAKSGVFYKKTYDGNGLVVDPVGNEQVSPQSVLCNEIGGQYDVDSKSGRALSRRRISWSFQLILRFSVEVELTGFLDSLTSPVTVVNVPEAGGKPYFLNLSRYEVSHPAQQGAAQGTEANLYFEVEQGRN